MCIYIVSNINNEIEFLSTLNKIYKYPNLEIIYDVKKLNSTEYIKKISNMYLVMQAENPKNKFSFDNEFYNKFYNDMLEIRQAVQVKNEDIYIISIYLVFTHDTEKELLSYSKYVQNSLYSQGIVIKPLNFRQLDAYFFSLFFNHKSNYLQKYLANTLTTSSLSVLFPYFNKNIIDKNGIIFGKVNNSICILDMFSNQYNNRNMCVFGSSGTGKSYFIKSILIRNMCHGVNQVVIDPEGEYGKIVKKLGGKVVDACNINILEFSETFFLKCNQQGVDVIGEKCRRIYNMFTNKDNDVNKYNKFYCILSKLYNDFHISNDKVYKSYSGNNEIAVSKVFVKCKDFPTCSNLVDKLRGREEFNDAITRLVKMAKYTQDLDEASYNTNTLVIDFSKLSGNEFELFMKIWIMKIEEDLRENTLIYIDEIWKVLQSGKSKTLANKIIEMYKTIRKKNAGIIGISQDVTDISLYGNGELGKGILSNSYFKLFFRFDYTAVDELSKLGIVSDNILKKIKLLDRGKAIMSMGGNIFDLEVSTSEYEHNLIMEE